MSDSNDTEPKQIAKRRDDALRRALSTPPQPKTTLQMKHQKAFDAEASGQKPEPLGEAS